MAMMIGGRGILREQPHSLHGLEFNPATPYGPLMLWAALPYLYAGIVDGANNQQVGAPPIEVWRGGRGHYANQPFQMLGQDGNSGPELKRETLNHPTLGTVRVLRNNAAVNGWGILRKPANGRRLLIPYNAHPIGFSIQYQDGDGDVQGDPRIFDYGQGGSEADHDFMWGLAGNEEAVRARFRPADGTTRTVTVNSTANHPDNDAWNIHVAGSYKNAGGNTTIFTEFMNADGTHEGPSPSTISGDQPWAPRLDSDLALFGSSDGVSLNPYDGAMLIVGMLTSEPFGWSTGSRERFVEHVFQNPWQLFRMPRRWFPVGTASGVTLTVQDATHGQVADSPTLTQQNTLAVDDSTHDQAADNLVLAAGLSLTVEDAQHSQVADALVLTQQNVLAVADADHAQTADTLNLSQAHTLAVAEALHQQTADAVALTQQNTIAVQDSLHTHTVDTLDLQSGLVLGVADALHAQSADELVLTQPNILLVQSAAHAQAADQVNLIQSVVLTVADALHGQTADGNLTLTSSALLEVQDALHAQLADQPALVQDSIIVVSDALHQQLADNIVFPGTVFQTNRLAVVRGHDRVVVVLPTDRLVIVRH